MEEVHGRPPQKNTEQRDCDGFKGKEELSDVEIRVVVCVFSKGR